MAHIEVLRPSVAQSEERAILVEAHGVGVRYLLGGKRDDLKSRTHDFLQRKQRQELWALRNVSFTLQAGEVVGVIGGNGAGKTTLCRVLAGLLRPDEGRISVRSSVSALLSLGAGFNTQLSGKENIFLNGLMLGLSKQQITDRLADIIAFSGLKRFIDQPLNHYSTGMRARLGFSIAAIMEPEILIVDETLSAGDLAFSRKAGEKIRELTCKAKLVIVVTHQLSFVQTSCTQALWLEQGMVKASGNAQEVAQLYESSAASPLPKRTLVNLPLATPRRGTSCVVNVQQVDVEFSLVAEKQRNKKNGSIRLPFWQKKTRAFGALKGVSFEVYEGEVFGIIGPNGAGKSTLCRVLAGIIKADKGEVTIAGEITALLTFGAGFNEQLSGRDNVFLNGMLLGIPKQELVAMYPGIVEFSGLARFMDHPLKHYSQGMRSRLGFSIAAMIKPDVFIIDEALSVGDAAFYERASVKIQELMTNAKAVIVVTHNMAFVKKVCTKALWLEAGEVRKIGKPGEVIEQYRQSLRR